MAATTWHKYQLFVASKANDYLQGKYGYNYKYRVTPLEDFGVLVELFIDSTDPNSPVFRRAECYVVQGTLRMVITDGKGDWVCEDHIRAY